MSDLIQHQIGWFHPQSKRFCYDDERAYMPDHFKGYTVAVVTADALEQAQAENKRLIKQLADVASYEGAAQRKRIEQLEAAATYLSGEVKDAWDLERISVGTFHAALAMDKMLVDRRWHRNE